MKKSKFSIIILSLALMLSVSVGTLAAAPSGYETANTTDFNGSVVGYDSVTKGAWLSPDGLYTGGDIDKNRIYGTEAYMIPMTKDAYLGKNKFNNFNKPIGIDYSDYSTWPVSHTYNFGEEGDLATIKCYSYTTTAAAFISSPGTEKQGNIQIPELFTGSLEQLATSGSYLSGDFGVVSEFNMADDEWHLFSIYLSGPLETYRVAIINDTFTDQGVYLDRGKHNESLLLADIASGRVDVDSYIDLTNYIAETGVYVTFKVKGDFTLIAGCKPDYTRQLTYGMNAQVFGFFFDSFKEDFADPVIQAMYTKLDSRQVSLQWESSDLSTSTTILRKLASADDNAWAPIAVVPKGMVSYVDKTADAGMSYNYAYASSIGGRYTHPRVITKTFDTDEGYTDTVLSFKADEVVTSKAFKTTVNKTINIDTYLKDADGKPIAGEYVYLRLEGKYIGGMISDVIYSKATNSDGKASIKVPCDFANQVDALGYHSYTLKIYTEYNDTPNLKYKPSSLSGTLTVENKKIDRQNTIPYILELSDSVKGGEILNITGSNLYEDAGISLYATPVEEDPVFDISKAIPLTDIIQYDPDRGNFINVRLPENFAGIYDIWAVNGRGEVSISHLETRLNAPRLFWISENSAFSGITIKAVGTNFLPSYFGMEGDTLVRLTNDKGDNYMMPILDVNNYCVEFMVTDIPLGEYYVSVSTDDGYTWSNFPYDQKLTIVPEGVGDPLGLGVAWANKFNYKDIFNVVDYGATPNDTTDDTNAFWIAIREAQLNGGGVVYVPRGTFYVTNVVMQNGVILMGESRKESVLAYCGVSGGMMITTSPECTGLFGIYNLHTTVVDPYVIPDQFFQLGDQWGSGTKNSHLRVSSYIFVKDVDCISPMLPVVENDRTDTNKRCRGIFAVVIMNEHFLMDNCYAYGTMAVLDRNYMNNYLRATNNHFEFLYDTVVMTSAYSLVEDNEVICRAEYYNIDVQNTKVREQSHGLFHRDRTYLAGNTIKNVGQLTTDGEVICAEPIHASYGYGMILSTGINENYTNKAGYSGRRYMDLGVDSGALVDISYGVFGRLTLIITGGTGMGQFRFIDDTLLLEGDNLNRVYLLETERDWDVVPDSTSTYSLERTMHNVVIYNNYAYDATKGLLLYGSFHDSIVAENYNENTEGICVWTAESLEVQRFNHNYRVTVRDNIVKGRSKCGYVGIGTSINFTMYTETNQNTANAHIEIRNNYLYGDRKDGYDSKENIVFRKYSTESEAPNLDGYYVYVFRNSTADYLNLAPYKTTNVLLANNYVENTLGGVYVGDYLINGVLVDNTTYVDVKYKHAYEEYYISKLNPAQYPPAPMLATIKNVIYSNEKVYATRDIYLAAVKEGDYVDYIAPVWEDSDIQLAPIGDQTYIWWTEARDDVEVEGYDVYLDGDEVSYVHTTDNYLLVNKRVSHVEVYALDTYGNVSNDSISCGESIIINGKTSIGSIAKAINNSFTYVLQAGLNTKVDNVSFVVNYDPNILNYVSATLEVDGNYTLNAYTGRLVVNVNLTKAYIDLTDIVKFNFEVKPGVSLDGLSNISFKLSDVKVKDGNYEFKTSLVASGERYLNIVSKETALDFTGDGLVNSADYNKVVEVLGSNTSSSNWISAIQRDINGDGIVDISDLMIVYYNMQKYD